MTNSNLSRRAFLAAGAGVLLNTRSDAAARAQTSSLKEAYKNAFLIGTALDFRKPEEFNSIELELIKSHFNVLTPENSMKPGSVHPQEDAWNFTQPDALVNFCGQNNMRTVGHTLVWHQQTNPWFFRDATREVALQRLKNHILTLVGRFKGKIMGWDVVNEAINNGGDSTTAATENLRRTQWLQVVGPDYLLQAFKFAREADPNVALHYNDYDIESGPKHQSSLLLLKRLISDGAPITTVGIQGHWSVTAMTAQKLEEIDQAIEDYKGLKLKVAITELDLAIAGAPTPESLQAQADAYAKLFAIFLRHRDVINRVTFWGLNDRRSWRAGQSPLIFDRENQAKPALQAIVSVAAR
jgi:GH35 family endo-1,4-beta-xylanase